MKYENQTTHILTRTYLVLVIWNHIYIIDMKDILLIYSGSCPNYKATRQMLEEIGLAFIEINQDDLHEGCFGKNFSSPTLLVDNDIVIFGGETDSSYGACTTSLPDKEDLRNLLNGLT